MNHFRKLEAVSIVLALMLALPVLAVAGQYEVVRVVDGDTIVEPVEKVNNTSIV